MKKMKKISIILVICLIMEIFAVNVFADNNAGSDKNQDENLIVREKLENEKEEYDEEFDINPGKMQKGASVTYTVSIAKKDATFTKVKSYTSFDSALSAMKSNTNANAVLLSSNKAGNKVIAMKDGIAVARPYRSSSASTMTVGYSYISNGYDMFYYETTSASKVTVGIAGQKGSANLSQVELIPRVVVDGWSSSIKQSYYYISSGMLYHKLAYYANENTGKTKPSDAGTYSVCAAPSFMKASTKYYSMDGINFYTKPNLTSKAGVNYNYYQFLPVRTKTKYTASQLNSYIKANNSSGKLVNSGASFIKAQNTYGVNAAILMCIAIHESAWGTSYYAKNRNNLFGIKAYDSDPDQASSFASVEDCVLRMAYRYVSMGYMDVLTDFRYYGGITGNKSIGMNVKYASDPYWGEKISGHFYRLDKYLGYKDKNAYKVAVAGQNKNLYKQATGSQKHYIIKNNATGTSFSPVPVVILGESGSRYKIASDGSITKSGKVDYNSVYNPTYSFGYVNKSGTNPINDLNTNKPSAPTNVKAASSDYQAIKLTWNKVSSASGYAVYRAGSKSGTYSKIATVSSGSTLSYKDTKKTTGSTYYYKIKAYNSKGTYSNYSSVVSASPKLSKPVMKLSSATYKSIKVIITKVSGASGYEIYRSNYKTKSFSKVVTTKELIYYNKKLKTQKTYYYKVRAYRTVNSKKVYSSYSNVGSCVPKISAPKLSGKRNGKNVSLSWTKRAGAQKYRVYCSKTKASGYKMQKDTTSLSYKYNNLDKNTVYYYKVRAYRVEDGKKLFGKYSNVFTCEK